LSFPKGHSGMDVSLIVNDSTDNEASHNASRLPLSLVRLVAMTLDFCGVFFAYSLQGVVIVPLFQSFGLTPSQTSLVMLISPIAVIVVYPLIGVLSDNCTFRLGRRRIFIAIGTLFQVTGLILLAAAPDLGHWLGDTLPPTGIDGGSDVPVQLWAVLIGVVGFSFVDFAAGVMQLPGRALLMDICPLSQQATGAALFAFWMSAGNALGFLGGSINWSQWTTFNTCFASLACPVGSCVNYRTLFSFAVVLDIITVTITIFSVSEVPVSHSPSKR
jgi:solute carrier family 45, member 1/2/4